MDVLQADGEDELKKMQLMELAIMNGTYREALPQPGATFVINTPRTVLSVTLDFFANNNW